MIEAVIFDLGNVLIDFDHRIAAKKIAEFTGKTGEEIYNLFFDSQLTRSFEEGKISPRQFFSGVKEILGVSIDYDEFSAVWNGIFFFSQKNLGVYNIARSLKKRYRIALLSNINALHLEYVRKTFPVFDAFDYFIASCEVGSCKPDPDIYQKALEVLKAEPQNVFYTDDRIELVESANRLGIKGFVFRGVEQLKSDLLASGINYEYAESIS